MIRKTAFIAAISMLMLSTAPVAAQYVAPEVGVLIEEPAVEMTKKKGARDALKPVLLSVYHDNPDILSSRQDLQNASEGIARAVANWRPNVSANAIWDSTERDPAQTSGRAETETYNISVSQPLFRGGRSLAAYKSADAAYMAQMAFHQSTQQQVFIQAITAYVDVVRDQSIYDLRSHNVKVLSRQLEATEDRFELGELTRTDVSQAQARLSAAKAQQREALGFYEVSKATYTQIVGLPANDLKKPEIWFDMPQTLDDAYQIAIRKNPLLQQSIYALEVSDQAVKEAMGAFLPEVSLTGVVGKNFNHGQGDPNEQSSSQIGVQATIPLYQAGNLRTAARSAKIDANKKRILIEKERRAVRQQVVYFWEKLKAAEIVIESRQAQIEAETVALEGVKAEEAYGTRDVLDVLNAEQTFLDAKVELIRGEHTRLVAVFELLASMGDLTMQRLALPTGDFSPEIYRDRAKKRWLGVSVDP